MYQKILDRYLQCWTKVAIGKELGIDEKTVKNVLERKNSKFTEIPFPKDFKPGTITHVIRNLKNFKNQIIENLKNFKNSITKNLKNFKNLVFKDFQDGRVWK